MNAASLKIIWQKKNYSVSYGTPIHQLFADKPFAKLRNSLPPLAALLDNELVDLRSSITRNGNLEEVTFASPEGYRINQQCLSFLFFYTLHKHFPAIKYRLSHSIGNSLFFTPIGEPLDSEKISLLEKSLIQLRSQNIPIEREEVPYTQAVAFFTEEDRHETVLLLDHMNEPSIPTIGIEKYKEISFGPTPKSTGNVSIFALKKYNSGILMHLPIQGTEYQLLPFKDVPFLSEVFNEYQNWGRILEAHTVGRLNTLVKNRRVKEFIWVVETLQNNKIASIAGDIRKKSNQIRVVLIAGPSSSGKTTFAKKLSIQLRAHGLLPQAISLDDFFVDRENTPLDADGNPDFEDVHAIDIPLLNQCLVDILDGKTTFLPTFDFKTGKQIRNLHPMSLSENGILIIEGIHGLNEALTPQISQSQKFKIYVSALTQINIDEEHRISTTDNRLIRRLVRDYRYRSHLAEATLGMWPSVRRGEDRNIFPFQNTAECVFNSAADYELGTLKPMAEALLREVKPNSPYYAQARRLLNLLSFFLPVQREFVPDQAILREFIGGSVFKY